MTSPCPGQGIAAVMRASTPATRTKHDAFYSWYFSYLSNHSSADTGYWPGKTASLTDQLGGAFHLYHIYHCFNKPWPHPQKVVDTTLSIQNKSTGMWLPFGPDKLSNCIDLDGVYALTRSSQLAGDSAVQPYRWGDVEAACALYVKTAHAQLSDPYNVLQGGWSENSHLIHGALFAVAECAAWFPGMVKTVRPWRRAGLGAAAADVNNKSCFYA